ALLVIITPIGDKKFVVGNGYIPWDLQTLYPAFLPEASLIYRYHLSTSHIAVDDIGIVTKHPNLFNIGSQHHPIDRLVEVVGHFPRCFIVMADLPITAKEVSFIDNQHAIVIGIGVLLRFW